MTPLTIVFNHTDPTIHAATTAVWEAWLKTVDTKHKIYAPHIESKGLVSDALSRFRSFSRCTLSGPALIVHSDVLPIPGVDLDADNTEPDYYGIQASSHSCQLLLATRAGRKVTGIEYHDMAVVRVNFGNGMQRTFGIALTDVEQNLHSYADPFYEQYLAPYVDINPLDRRYNSSPQGSLQRATLACVAYGGIKLLHYRGSHNKNRFLKHANHFYSLDLPADLYGSL